MKFHKQTVLYVKGDKKQRGNCLQTAYACALDLELSEVPAFQLLYWNEDEVANMQSVFKNKEVDVKAIEGIASMLWADVEEFWLASKGYKTEWFYPQDNNGPKDEILLAIGTSPRDPENTTHICFYKNGELYHDPHPSNDGLERLKYYKRLVKVTNGASEGNGL